MNYRVLKTKQILDHLTQLRHSQVWRLRPMGARWILWVAKGQVFHPNSGPEYGASWFIALPEWPWTFESSFWNVRVVISVGDSQTKQQHLWPSLLLSLAQHPWLSVGNARCLLCDSGRDDNVNSSCFSLWRVSPPQTLCPQAQPGSEKIRIPELHPWSRGLTESTLHSGMPFSSSATPGKAQICRAWDPEMYE